MRFSTFTLIAPTATIAIAVALFAGSHGCRNERPGAEEQGREYLQTMHPHATSRVVTCMNVDTDNNGYVSCDAMVDGQPVSLECAAVATCFIPPCNRGCKLRPLVQIQQTQGQQ